jgi:hypothetical protein
LGSVAPAGRFAKILPESFSLVGGLDSHTFGYGLTGRKPSGLLHNPRRSGWFRRRLGVTLISTPSWDVSSIYAISYCSRLPSATRVALSSSPQT